MIPFSPIIPRFEQYAGRLDTAALFSEDGSLWGMVREPLRRELEPLLRGVNCYYSHQIEGFQTDPIEAAGPVRPSHSADDARILAAAHLRVQAQLHTKMGTGLSPFSAEFLGWLHRELLSPLPPRLLMVKNDSGREFQVTPGVFRTRDVRVGMHVPPAHSDLPSLMAQFEKSYQEPKGALSTIAIAASHHRLVWLHPFYDGNGRVARLFTDALLSKAPFRAHGLWTLSRGLALRQAAYKAALARADHGRDTDVDGRGPLGERALVEFCEFFFETIRDQVRYMAQHLEIQEMSIRLEILVRTKLPSVVLQEPAARLLRGALIEGEFARGEASRVSGTSERTARRIVSVLVSKGWLKSDSEKGPLRLGITLEVLETCFPGLYPQAYLVQKMGDKKREGIQYINTLKIEKEQVFQKPRI